METGITGQGADILIIDDPINADDANYENLRNKANRTFDSAIQSRLNNRAEAAIVMLGQRLHQDDPSGHLERKETFEQLVVPLIAPEHTIYEVGDFRWERPAGDVLDPESNTPEEVDTLRKENTAGDFEAQYQQNPIPPAGEHLKMTWFPRWDEIPKSANLRVMTWDVAGHGGKNSSFSACLVFRTDLKTHYLEHIWRGRSEFNELVDIAESLIADYEPDAIIIENAAMGPALLDVLADCGYKPEGIPQPSESKLLRLKRHLAKFKSGSVVLPSKHPLLGEFLNELQSFPHGTSDDMIDAMTQYLAWLASPQGLKSPPKIAKVHSLKYRGGHLMSPTPRKHHPQRNPKAPRLRRV